MKKQIIVLLIAIFLITLCSCEKLEALLDKSTVASTTVVETNMQDELNRAMQLYKEFLGGKHSVTDREGYTLYIENFFIGTYDRPDDYKECYAYYDMNGDGIPELHVKGVVYGILSCINSELVFWSCFGRGAKPLNSGAIFYEGHEDERPAYDCIRTSCYYMELDFYGQEKSRVSFVKIQSEDERVNSVWYFGNEEVSKEEWNTLTEPYFSIGSDKVEWIEYVPQ